MTIEVDGKLTHGFSGDCFSLGWFEKTLGKSFRQQIDDMVAVIDAAGKGFLEKFR